MPRILIREPNHFYTYELPVAPGGAVVVGSAPTCQLALPGVGGLAPAHARIVCQPQGYVIEDLQSQYGILQNGRRVQAEYMTPGAEYMLGAACITLDPASMPAAQPQQVQQHTEAPKTTQSAPAKEAAQHTATKPRVMKKAASAGGSGGTAGGGADLDKLVKKYERGGGSKLTFVYVLILLLLAFYAGIALRHWQRTGNCLPGIVADGN